MEIVFDSSTLILLAKIEVLRSVSEECGIITPPMVRDESIKPDTYDSALISSLIKEGIVEVVAQTDKKMVKNLGADFRIHKGEAEALALAIMKNVPLAVDDLPVMKACKILNRPFTTAIHLLLKIAASGRIGGDSALVKLEGLAHFGRYSKRIMDDANGRLRGGA